MLTNPKRRSFHLDIWQEHLKLSRIEPIQSRSMGGRRSYELEMGSRGQLKMRNKFLLLESSLNQWNEGRTSVHRPSFSSHMPRGSHSCQRWVSHWKNFQEIWTKHFFRQFYTLIGLHFADPTACQPISSIFLWHCIACLIVRESGTFVFLCQLHSMRSGFLTKIKSFKLPLKFYSTKAIALQQDLFTSSAKV